MSFLQLDIQCSYNLRCCLCESDCLFSSIIVDAVFKIYATKFFQFQVVRVPNKTIFSKWKNRQYLRHETVDLEWWWNVWNDGSADILVMMAVDWNRRARGISLRFDGAAFIERNIDKSIGVKLTIFVKTGDCSSVVRCQNFWAGHIDAGVVIGKSWVPFCSATVTDSNRKPTLNATGATEKSALSSAGSTVYFWSANKMICLWALLCWPFSIIVAHCGAIIAKVFILTLIIQVSFVPSRLSICPIKPCDFYTLCIAPLGVRVVFCHTFDKV